MSIRQDTAQLIIHIDSEESREFQSTIKTTRGLVKDLKKAEIGSEEYNRALGEIIKSNKTLQGADFTKLTGKNLRDRQRQLYQLRDSLTQVAFAENGFEKELRDVNAALAEQRARISGVRQRTGMLKKSLMAIGPAIVAAFAVDRIVAFTKQLFDTQTELAAIENRFNTVFGESSTLIRAWGEQNAISLGLTTGEFERAASAAGDLLKPMGFNEEAAARLSIELLTTSAALREFDGNNRSTEETTEILNKALLGEREQLKSLGVSIQEADVKRRLAEKGQKNLTGEHLKQAKALATLELIQESATDSVASFEAGTNTAAKSQAILQARTRQLVEDLGTKLRPVFATILVFAEKVFRQFTEGADTTTTLGKGVDFVQKSFRFLAGIFGIVWSVGKGLFQTFVDIYNGSQLLRDGISFLLTPFRLIYTAITESSALTAGFQAAVEQMVDNVQQRLLRAANTFEIFKLKAQRALTFNDDAEQQLTERIKALEELNKISIESGRSVAEAFNSVFDETIANTELPDVERKVTLSGVIEVDEIVPGGAGTTGSGNGVGTTGQAARPTIAAPEAIETIAPRAIESEAGPFQLSDEEVNDYIKSLEAAGERELDELERQALTKLITEQEYEEQRLQAQIDNYDLRLDTLVAAGLSETEVFRKTELEKLRIQKELGEKQVANARRTETIKRNLKEEGLKVAGDAFSAFKDLLSKDQEARKKHSSAIKAFEIADVIVKGFKERQAIRASYAKFGPLGTVLGQIQVGLSFVRTLAAIRGITAQQFYRGGKILPSITGRKVSDQPNVPTQKGGDNVLALLKPGEVVLNEDQQARAGGSSFFKSLGVPGFNTGGIIPMVQTIQASAPSVAPTGITPQTMGSTDRLEGILLKIDKTLDRFPRQSTVSLTDINQAQSVIDLLEQQSSY